MSAVRWTGHTSHGSWDKRGFWALIATQFQGAFNDNAYRWIITYYLFDVCKKSSATGTLDGSKAATITALGAILFAAPFILFPGIAGALADRYSKRSVAVATKVWEVGVMILGLVAFALKNEILIWSMLFMMNMQSTFFSPAKYGILPEMLPEDQLSWGNGILNLATFVSIIAGTAVAGLLFWLGLHVYLMSGLLILLSSLGVLSSLFITPVPAANPARRVTLNPWGGLGRPMKLLFTDRVLLLMMVGSTCFWSVGAIMQQNIPVYARVTLGVDELRTSLLIAIVGIGIGCGSFGAGYFSRGKIELGLVPLGMTGLTVFVTLLAFPGHGLGAALALLLFVGFSAGFYIVPIYATIQHRSPRDLKGGTIAALNVMDCGGILLAGALFLVGGRFHVSSAAFFSFSGLVTLAVGIILCTVSPYFLLRFGLWLLSNTVYRVRVRGAENIPENVGAVLVANHTSCVDALVLAASTGHRVRFVMADALFAPDAFKFDRRCLGLPVGHVAEASDAQNLAMQFDSAALAIERGELVCLFKDGLPAPNGGILRFEEALAEITRRVDAPIIPVFVDATLENLLRVRNGRLRWKKPPSIPYPIMVSYGPPLPHNIPSHAVSAAIAEAGVQAYSERLWPEPLLHRAFIRTARRHLLLMAAADVRTSGVSFFKALVGTIILGRKLRDPLRNDAAVGVLLPPTVGGALTNIALQMMGKVAVNLNYTVSAETMASCARRADVTHVITAHAFLERLPLEVPGEAIYLEDVMALVRGRDRLLGMLMALFATKGRIERFVGAPRRRSEHDVAAIIFSSGSEGDPKGVMLTHFNLLSNIDAAIKVFPHRVGDVMMGILPFFHSFGYTGTLWLPLIEPLGAAYYPNPLEAKSIGKFIARYKAWFFVATSTFLQNFTRRCPPEDLASLGYVICGAEKLTARVRTAFHEKFGTEPLEGYGITECSPIICLSLPDVRVPGVYRPGTRHGTIGRPVPGVSVRVQDPDSREILPPNTPGMLMVKGPNVMKGYLGMPERTAAVIRDGWYETGDIAAIDKDGFITITDRQARFSKIGGEMVPHIRVEEALHEMLGLTEQALAVAGVPDAVKGEHLVVLHTLGDGQLEELLRKLDDSDLPNLWRPRPTAFHRIDALPVLGSGKMDIGTVKRLAQELDKRA